MALLSKFAVQCDQCGRATDWDRARNESAASAWRYAKADGWKRSGAKGITRNFERYEHLCPHCAAEQQQVAAR